MNSRQLLDLMERSIAWLAGIPLLLILAFLSFISLLIGLFLINKPSLAIEMQQKFYAGINWKMEPISMKKEIRNTRFMGWLLITLFIATLLLLLFQKSIFL